MDDAQKLTKALTELKTRGIRVEKRDRYFTGNHPTPPGSVAWSKTFGPQLKGVRDNQCKLVVQAHAEALVPAGVKARTTDKLDSAHAAWVTERFIDEAAAFDKAVTDAEALGEQLTIAVDYNASGEVDFYPLDPRSCYVQLDRGGDYLWAVHFWKAEDGPGTHATIYTPERVAHYQSAARTLLPSAEDFHLLEETPNPFGEVMLATVDKGGSVIDDIAPLNDVLNKLMQASMVVAEGYALPRTVWMGLSTFDSDAGELTTPNLAVNPATNSRDVIFPTVVDEEGDKRSVVQLPSPEPEKYLKDMDSIRASIARDGSVPASRLQLGGVPASGEALEMEYIPFVATNGRNVRSYYRPYFNRLARLAVRRRLYKLTGQPMEAPTLETQFPKVAATTTSTRTAEFAAGIAAGMTLRDALVEFMGWDREAADIIQANSDARAAAAADRAAALVDQGYLGA